MSEEIKEIKLQLREIQKQIQQIQQMLVFLESGPISAIIALHTIVDPEKRGEGAKKTLNRLRKRQIDY